MGAVAPKANKHCVIFNKQFKLKIKGHDYVRKYLEAPIFSYNAGLLLRNVCNWNVL